MHKKKFVTRKKGILNNEIPLFPVYVFTNRTGIYERLQYIPLTVNSVPEFEVKMVVTGVYEKRCGYLVRI